MSRETRRVTHVTQARHGGVDVWEIHLAIDGVDAPHFVIMPLDTLDWRKATFGLADDDDAAALDMVLHEMHEPEQDGPADGCPGCQTTPHLWSWCPGCKQRRQDAAHEVLDVTDPDGLLAQIHNARRPAGELADKRHTIKTHRDGGAV